MGLGLAIVLESIPRELGSIDQEGIGLQMSVLVWVSEGSGSWAVSRRKP